MKIAAHTLGCKLNYAETSHLLRQLSADGHDIVSFPSPADLYIINTCTVTAVAEKKCRNAIRQAIHSNPSAKVAVIGCFAQNAANQVAQIPGVSFVLGNDRKHLLPQLLAQGLLDADAPLPAPSSSMPFAPAFSSGDRTRAFFKIQDGCDYFCTYCAIPYARGRSRSASLDDTLQMAHQVAASGAKEVVLTGVNTGTFGQQQGHSLLQLLQRLDAIPDILRYRISSIEPNLITDEIVDFVASSRAFLPHFHIPLQAGSDKVLRLMNRRYDTALYRRKLDYIKHRMPDACIAADIMAGFNGETDDEFLHVLDFVDSLPISYLHVFTYSERPNTAAQRLPERIPIEQRREHTHRLLQLSAQKHQAFIASQLGQQRPVLWESSRHGDMMQGWTDNYIRLQRPYDPLLVGTITPAIVDLQHVVND